MLPLFPLLVLSTIIACQPTRIPSTLLAPSLNSPDGSFEVPDTDLVVEYAFFPDRQRVWPIPTAEAFERLANALDLIPGQLTARVQERCYDSTISIEPVPGRIILTHQASAVLRRFAGYYEESEEFFTLSYRVNSHGSDVARGEVVKNGRGSVVGRDFEVG